MMSFPLFYKDYIGVKNNITRDQNGVVAYFTVFGDTGGFGRHYLAFQVVNGQVDTIAHDISIVKHGALSIQIARRDMAQRAEALHRFVREHLK